MSGEISVTRLNRELRAVTRCLQTLLLSENEPALLSDICRIVCEEAGYRMAWVGYSEDDAQKSIRAVANADGIIASAIGGKILFEILHKAPASEGTLFDDSLNRAREFGAKRRMVRSQI